MKPLRTHDRYDYVPLRGRPDYSWPGGRRLAVYFALNLEHFSFGEGLGAELSPGGPQPDVLNFAWRDYGNRVGLWYYFDLFDEFGIPGAHNVNSSVLEACPAIVERMNAAIQEALAVSSAITSTSEGPAIMSMPTLPNTSRLAAAT